MIKEVGVIVYWAPSVDRGDPDPVFMDLQAFFSPNALLGRPEWPGAPAGVALGSIPAHTLDGFTRHAERVAIEHQRDSGLRSLQVLRDTVSSWETCFAFGDAAGRN